MKGSKVHLQIPRWNLALRAKPLKAGVSTGEGVSYPPTVSADLVDERGWRAFGDHIWPSEMPVDPAGVLA